MSNTPGQALFEQCNPALLQRQIRRENKVFLSGLVVYISEICIGYKLLFQNIAEGSAWLRRSPLDASVSCPRDSLSYWAGPVAAVVRPCCCTEHVLQTGVAKLAPVYDWWCCVTLCADPTMFV